MPLSDLGLNVKILLVMFGLFKGISSLRRDSLVLGSIVLWHTAALAATNQPGFLPLSSPGKGHITDLVLIYQGGAKRLRWTPEQLAPYVTWKNATPERWLFDGFLFIEFSDGRGHEYAAGYTRKPAGKAQWAWLIQQNFAPKLAIAALDECLDKAISRIGTPSVKRKVVLTLPEPIHSATNWGSLSGRPLDFTVLGDRLAACEWHMDEAVAQWKKLNPKHLELAGFYWVAEQSSHARALLPKVANAAHSRGLRMYWIPYWNAAGAQEWRELGFDFAWLQPNHFFNPKVADERLSQAAALAKEKGLGLEFEMDARAVSDPKNFRPRFYAYLNGFDREGAGTGASVAYYEGGGALLQMAHSSEPEVRELYDTLGKWVAERQLRRANSASSVQPGQGRTNE